MSRDRRAFRFALQPVYTSAQWKIDEILALNAGLRQALALLESQAAELATAIVRSGSELLASEGSAGLIDIDARRRANGYLVHLRTRQASLEPELSAARQAWDDGVARLRLARQFAEGLERHREAALSEHDETIARQGYQSASDDWLQRMQWRNRR